MKNANNYESVICSITVDKANRTLFDCDNKKVYMITDTEKLKYDNVGNVLSYGLDVKIQFNRKINEKYREKQGQTTKDELSVVWTLKGKNKNEEHETILQVGRSKSLEAMLKNDINPDTNAILEGDDLNKYHKQKYDQLTFYQVDIDSYLKNCEEVFQIQINKDAENLDLMKALYVFKASYVEGKLAYDAKAKEKLWNASGGIDGDIYNYFQRKKQS